MTWSQNSSGKWVFVNNGIGYANDPTHAMFLILINYQTLLQPMQLLVLNQTQQVKHQTQI